ncbi:MAG: type III-A CRISPR-associated protein Csm2 [Candidatus Methanospirareceae archaeon]
MDKRLLDKLLGEGKLIELCNLIKNNRRDKHLVDTWCNQQETRYITPLKSSTNIDSSDMLSASCIMGSKLAVDSVTSTQLRRVITGFHRLQETCKNSELSEAEVSKLRLNLAYATARNYKITKLSGVLDAMLGKVQTEGREDFDRVVTFMEGVIAYHKLAGGGD